jgi:hypothetical protein
MVNGGHGIKNPLFDCATEALQIKYGKYNKIIPRKNNLSHFLSSIFPSSLFSQN